MLPKHGLFFYIANDQVVLWDTKGHRQYLLNTSELNVLLNACKVEVGEAVREEILAFVKHENLLHEAKNDPVWPYESTSYIYHHATRNIEFTGSELDRTPYIEAVKEQNLIIQEKLNFLKEEVYGGPDSIKLCNIESKETEEIRAILDQRKTVRVFREYEIPFNTFSEILSLGCGFRQFNNFSNDADEILIGKRKSAASMGNLHPTKFHIIAHNISGL